MMDFAELKQLVIHAKELRAQMNISSNAVRVVNGVSDKLSGLFIEKYNQHYQIQITDSQWFVHLEALVELLKDLCDPRFIVLRHRFGGDGQILAKPELKVLFDSGCGPITTVSEYNFQFKIDLMSSIHPGLYLDSRVIRQKSTKDSQGKKVLNAFSFTGSFGVYSKGKGAIFTANVDMSPKALERAKENYRLNELEFSESEFVRSDVRDYLKICWNKKFFFDSVIIDQMPNSAKTNRGTFLAKNELPQLISLAMKVLNSRADFFISTTCSEVTGKMLQSWVENTAHQLGFDIEKSVVYGRDVDFNTDSSLKDQNFHAFWVKMEKR